jgi:hypothetical protein
MKKAVLLTGMGRSTRVPACLSRDFTTKFGADLGNACGAGHTRNGGQQGSKQI